MFSLIIVSCDRFLQYWNLLLSLKCNLKFLVVMHCSRFSSSSLTSFTVSFHMTAYILKYTCVHACVNSHTQYYIINSACRHAPSHMLAHLGTKVQVFHYSLHITVSFTLKCIFWNCWILWLSIVRFHQLYLPVFTCALSRMKSVRWLAGWWSETQHRIFYVFCYYYLKMTGISAGVAEAIACFGDLYCVQTSRGCS